MVINIIGIVETQTHLALIWRMMMNILDHDGVPAIGTEAFKVWWESQYDDAESLHVDRSNIHTVEGTPLELNQVFWETD